MSADAASNPGFNEVEQIPDAHHPAGVGLIKPGYDPPAGERGPGAAAASRPGARTTSSRSGCPTCTASAATSRRAACSRSGIAGWQVLIALLDRHRHREVFCNLVAKPSQETGVPYPVINRAIFGVRGANIPAIIRGLIAVAWYGVQTYLAAESLIIIFLKFFPASQRR